MDFSWATITFIDIGIFSLGVIAVATGWIIQKREAKRYNTLQQAFSSFQSTADRRYNALQQVCETLQEEHETLQGAYETLQGAYETLRKEHRTLQEEHETLKKENAILKEENATLRAAINALTTEQKVLQSST